MKTICERPLTDMISADELSAASIIINSAQNVLSTSELEITIHLVPLGCAEHIKINIGFTVSASV